MSQKETFWEIIEIFEQNGILEHVMLIGSWAEFIYQESGYFDGFEANLRTRDIDLLIRNIRRPTNKISLIEALEEKGFVTEIDYIDGVHKFYKGSDLEIEFIVAEIGKGQTDPYEIKPFGIKAVGLRNMDILLDNETIMLCNGFNIKVPLPEAYLLQKMMINSMRKDKQEKDVSAILNMFFHMEKSERAMETLKKTLESLTVKQRQKVRDFAQKYKIDL